MIGESICQIWVNLFSYCSVVDSGAYRIINGTCEHEEFSKVTLAGQNKCPALRNLKLPCKFTTGVVHKASILGTVLMMVIVKYVIKWQEL